MLETLFEFIDNSSFETSEKAVTETIKSDSKIAVICSSDDLYPKFAADYTKQLKAKNPNIYVVLAGYPKEIIDELKEAGVDEFIHLKVNPFDCLTSIQKKLGIE